jgi:protocatechuate 3,4-dioxygenase beta subunit
MTVAGRLRVETTLILALAFGAGTIGAQTPARDAVGGTVPVGTGLLSGVVVDGEKKVLRRASVSLSGDMRLNRRTVTDEAGRFAFADLPTGRFTLTATKGGYPPMSYGAKRPYRTGSGILLKEGQQQTDLVLTLPKGAVMTGTVFDDHGQPMPGVPVMAWEVTTSLSGERTLATAANAGNGVITDDRGVYRVYGLPPGEYTMGTAWHFSSSGADVRVPTDAEIREAFQAATQPGPSSLLRATPATPPPPAPRYSYTPVFYPDSTDPLAAMTIPLAAGEERDHVDIHMQFRPMSRIEGIVLSADGSPQRAEMQLARRNRVEALNSTMFWGTSPDGRFTTGSVGPGDFTVMAEVVGTPGAPAFWALADVTISGPDPVNLTLRLQPSMALTGQLVFEGTLPPPPDLTRILVSLFPVGAGTRSNSMRSTTDAAGNVSVSPVTPRRYRVVANVPNTAAPGAPAWSLLSATIGGRDITDLPIDIGPGEAPSVIVTFTDQVSELSGRLLSASGEPMTDYYVVVLPAARQYWLPQTRRIASARPDANGRYIFRGLPAGEYRVAATTDLLPRDLSDVNALAQLAAQSAPVTLALGEKKTFDMKIK